MEKVQILVQGLFCHQADIKTLNVKTKTIDGIMVVDGDFESVEEAIEYIEIRILMFYQQNMGLADYVIDQFRTQGTVTLGSVTLEIKKMKI